MRRGGVLIIANSEYICAKNIAWPRRIFLLDTFPSNQRLYHEMEGYGYKLIFKPVVGDGDSVKGNVDAELVLQAMHEYPNYDKAVIVSGDGDFYCLVKYLYERDKFSRLIVPDKYKYSVLLRRSFPRKEGITFLNDLRKRLGDRGANIIPHA